MDFKRLKKAYKKLGVPKGLYDPTTAPLESAKYFVLTTERKSGKTTNVLLLGMLAHKLYGVEIQYIRQYDIMLAPKNARDLMDVIISNDYIEKLTDGKYNTAVYKSRRWYYARSADGDIVEQALDPFMTCLSIDNNEVYKSSYNAPKGDFIIFDEFCASRHMPDEFIRFADLLSTIIRGRKDPIIWMLGNTIDRYEYYYDELEIADYMRYIKMGESMLVSTAKGTPIYIEIFQLATSLKDRVNKLFFGFKNPRLNAITGEDWLIVPYQHIDRYDEREVIDSTHYLEYESNLLQLEVVHSERYGLHVIVHKSTNREKSGTIYSCDTMLDIRYKYRFGWSNLDKMIWTLYSRKKFFYATNSDAAIVSKYVNLADNSKL